MKRTKNTMVRRAKKAPPTTQGAPPLPSGTMGGHTPNPPEDCPGRIRRSPADPRLYVDNASCFDCPKRGTCQRRKENDQEWIEYRAWAKRSE